MSDYPLFDEVVDDIEQGVTEVNGKYNEIGRAATTLCDVNQIASQVSNVTVVHNRNGDVIGYDYKYTTPYLPDPAAMGVDSNADNGLYAEGGGGRSGGGGAGRYRSSTYAGEIIDPEASMYQDKLYGRGLVSSPISVGWAAVSTLSKLGRNVAAQAADALDALDVHFGANYGGLTVDMPAGNAVRALFGIHNSTVEMYLEEDVIGALAIQAKEDGFLSEGEPIYPPVQYPVTITSIGNVMDAVYTVLSYVPTTYSFTDNMSHLYDFIAQYGQYPCRVSITLSSGAYGSSNAFTVSAYTQLGVGSVVANGSEIQPGVRELRYRGDRGGAGGNLKLAYNVVANNNRGFFYGLSIGGSATAGTSNVEHSSTVPGVTDQQGATDMVDAITGADPHVVAQNLAAQYPTVMGSPVQIVVMDDSCNMVTKNYYTIPISYSPTNLNINAPLTGTVQVSPELNIDFPDLYPEINFDNYVDQIIKVLTGSGAGREVTTEPEPDDPDTPSSSIPGDAPAVIPDTGTGTTPPTTNPSVDVDSMWHIYYVFPEQLSALGSWLWSTNIIDQIVRLFQNPMEAIMGVHALYCMPTFGSQVPIVVGNLTSTANGMPLTGQYLVLDCGSVWLTEYFGNVFDYDPYTEVSLYLPFVGIVKLDTADVMRAKITVRYGIDCYTGACLAKVIVERDGAGGVLYEYPGNCAVEYPVSGASYSRMLQSIVAAGMSAVAVGVRAEGAPGSELLGAAAAGSTFLSSGKKSSIHRAGSLGGNAGVMGSKKPYLIISRPQTNMANHFEHYQGIPCNNQVAINSLHGYQRFESVHLRCPSAYGEELQEIESLLKAGVLI